VDGARRGKVLVERKIQSLTVRINREMCIGSANCTKLAPDVFELDDEQIVSFKKEISNMDSAKLVEACGVCPVNALIVIDAQGKQIVPKSS